MGRKESNQTSMYGSRNFCQGGGGGVQARNVKFGMILRRSAISELSSSEVSGRMPCPSLLCSHMQYSPYYNQAITNLAFCLLAMSSADGKHFGPRSGPREDQD